MNSTYDVMKGRPWRAVNFDWSFVVGDNRLSGRGAIINERQTFVKMLQDLKFQIYPFEQNKDVKLTRNLSKSTFMDYLKEFKRLCCEEPCGCLLVTVSSHGVILPQDEQTDRQTDNVETKDKQTDNVEPKDKQTDNVETKEEQTDRHTDEEETQDRQTDNVETQVRQTDKVKTYEDYVLTHPEPDKNKFSPNFEEERVSVQEIVEVFRDQRLKGIPKIFFIQACRNESKHNTTEKEDLDEGVELSVEDKDSEENVSRISAKIPQTPPENQIVYSPPCIDDSVIVFSTPFGYATGFESVRGSHVWGYLTRTFREFRKARRPVKLLDLLRETNWQLSKSENTIDINQKSVVYKPLFSVCHTLTRHIVFEDI